MRASRQRLTFILRRRQQVMVVEWRDGVAIAIQWIPAGFGFGCEIDSLPSIRLNCFCACLTVSIVASKLRSRRQGVAAACREECIYHDKIVIEVMTTR